MVQMILNILSKFQGVNMEPEIFEKEIIMTGENAKIVVQPGLTEAYLDVLLEEYEYVAFVLQHTKASFNLYMRSAYAPNTIQEVIAKLEFRKAELDMHINAVRRSLELRNFQA